MITATDLLALLPLIVLSAVAVIVMLAIAVHRNHRLAFLLTVAGILISLITVPLVSDLVPRLITPLVLVDRYALVFTVMAYAAGLVAAVLCWEYFRVREGHQEEVYLLILTALLGAGVLAAAHHFASFFLGLEILSVSLFALIAYPLRENRALEAGIKYLVLSGVASAFLLFGMALVYAETGTMEFAVLGGRPGTFPSVIGTILILVAVGFKLSLVPFHLWTADVYQGAPAPITALLATVSKGSVFILLLRYGLESGVFRVPVVSVLLALIAVVSMLVGNFLALRQNNVKRILAYSSIGHMGYLLVAPVAANVVGGNLAAEALLVYLAAYFAMTLAAFGVVTVMSPADREAEELDDYTGLFWTRPWLATVFSVALLSLAGIPLTAGFIGKFYLFTAGSHGALWMLLGALIIGSGLGLYYYIRIVFQMAQAPAALQARPEARPVGAHLVLAILLLLIFGLGVYPAPFIDLLHPEINVPKQSAAQQ
ncbi:NADH-quinone oxidoreductase subunit N [Methylocaldum sp. RMAD-M]|uniref:NADH-quinone oxidoreductase subunit N n=1 Tax=Methylocaldum sp. RMAD-M TaxID=2806557 RepID=UPI001B50F384|nr:NADH-quinone oxidoreductase subunit N [Methylocaldum sp. RMAD-M]MBP1148270.1 NADH-quinone oxidoreductase subunit N [Methylocaldum sp. RMAD-M]